MLYEEANIKIIDSINKTNNNLENPKLNDLKLPSLRRLMENIIEGSTQEIVKEIKDYFIAKYFS